MTRLSSRRRGGALLAVMWLAAALAALAFSAAQIVRAGRERTQNQMEGSQASLLASAALERVLFEMDLNLRPQPGVDRWVLGRPFVRVSFPTGEALVEVANESAKIDINRAPPEMLTQLLVALGVAPPMASQLAASIVMWRSPVAVVGVGLDPVQVQAGSTFRAPHASLQQIEELLPVPGMSPELFYGRLERTSDGGWVPRAGLRDCVSVYGALGGFEVNSVQPAVLLAGGVPPMAVAQIVDMRRQGPILPEQVALLAQGLGPAAGMVGMGRGTVFTLRSTARVRLPNGRLSELRRTETQTVSIHPKDAPTRIRVFAAHAGAAARSLEETWPW